MPSKLDDLVFEVEAVLFAAGKPLSSREVASALGVDDPRPVQRAVKTLEETYRHRQSALEVRRVGDRYALQLQERFVPLVHAVTPVEMAPRTLKALTLIAYHQPVLQSVLVRMIGEVAYEEVQHLRGLGLVRTEPKGATLELSTTRRFAEYFGIPSGRPEEIRRLLEQKLGVPAATVPPEAPGADTPDPARDASEPPGPPPAAEPAVPAEQPAADPAPPVT
jgi:segregation and condensation protein B